MASENSTTTGDEVDAIVDQWESERPDLSPRAIGVFGRIARLNTFQRIRLQRVHEANGLSLAAFDVLANLRRSGPEHKKTAGELAESSLLTSGGITFRLDRMEADGLIVRERSTVDRRVVYAGLTNRGREIIDVVFGEHLAAEEEMLAGLTDDEITQLCDLLRKLVASVAKSL